MPELTGLQATAQRKRDATIQRATAALAELAEQGAQISFQSVARRAGVSRQWLYDQPALRTQIEQLREQLRERPAQGVPARERASDASLQQRLRGLLDETRRCANKSERSRTSSHSPTVSNGTSAAADPRRQVLAAAGTSFATSTGEVVDHVAP